MMDSRKTHFWITVAITVVFLYWIWEITPDKSNYPIPQTGNPAVDAYVVASQAKDAAIDNGRRIAAVITYIGILAIVWAHSLFFRLDSQENDSANCSNIDKTLCTFI